jgi:hypothetical protein
MVPDTFSRRHRASSNASMPCRATGLHGVDGIGLIGIRVELCLADLRQIGALRQELAQSVGVLVAAALSGRVGVGEPDVDVQALREFDMAGHLASPVIGQTLTQERRQFLQFGV